MAKKKPSVPGWVSMKRLEQMIVEKVTKQSWERLVRETK